MGRVLTLQRNPRRGGSTAHGCGVCHRPEPNRVSVTGDDTVPKCLVTEKRFAVNGVKKKKGVN